MIAELELPDGQWFLILPDRGEWQFMKMVDFGYQPTSLRRHGEPFPGARERAIDQGFVVHKDG